MVHDLSMKALQVPGLRDYTPELGTLKDIGTSLTTLEVVNNMSLPYRRKFLLTDGDTVAGPVEADATICYTATSSQILDLKAIQGKEGVRLDFVLDGTGSLELLLSNDGGDDTTVTIDSTNPICTIFPRMITDVQSGWIAFSGTGGGSGGGDTPVPTPTPTPDTWLPKYVDDPDIMDDSEYDLVIDSDAKLAQAIFTVGVDGSELAAKYNRVKVKKGTWTYTGLTDIPQTGIGDIPITALAVGECLHAEPGARLVLKGTTYGIIVYMDAVLSVPTVRNLEIDIQPLVMCSQAVYNFSMDNCYIKLSADYHQTFYNELVDKSMMFPVPMVQYGATGTGYSVCSDSVWYNDSCMLVAPMLYGYNVHNCDITDIRPFRTLSGTDKVVPCTILSTSNNIKDTHIHTIFTDKYDKDIISAVPELAGAIGIAYYAIAYSTTSTTPSLSIDNCSIDIELDCHSELVEDSSNRIFSGELSSLNVRGIMFNDGALCTMSNCNININLSDTDAVLYGDTTGIIQVGGVQVPTINTATASSGGTMCNCNVNITGILSVGPLDEALFGYSGCTNMYNCTAHLCGANPVDYRQDYNSKTVKFGTLIGFILCSNVSNSKAICSRHVEAYGFGQCNGLFKCLANAKDGWTDATVTAFNTNNCSSNIGTYDVTYAANETMNGGYNVALDVAAAMPLL